jgi:hypothetical protein
VGNRVAYIKESLALTEGHDEETVTSSMYIWAFIINPQVRAPKDGLNTEVAIDVFSTNFI